VTMPMLPLLMVEMTMALPAARSSKALAPMTTMAADAATTTPTSQSRRTPEADSNERMRKKTRSSLPVTSACRWGWWIGLWRLSAVRCSSSRSSSPKPSAHPGRRPLSPLQLEWHFTDKVCGVLCHVGAERRLRVPGDSGAREMRA